MRIIDNFIENDFYISVWDWNSTYRKLFVLLLPISLPLYMLYFISMFLVIVSIAWVIFIIVFPIYIIIQFDKHWRGEYDKTK